MFANDLTGLSRGNFLGSDLASQIPVAVNAWGQIPYGYGLGAYNVAPQIFPPSYGVIFHRIPQTYIPQTMAPQGIGTLGQIPTNQPFVPVLTMNAPIANPLLAQGGLMTNTLGIGYGLSPFTVAPWGSPLGVQPTICR